MNDLKNLTDTQLVIAYQQTKTHPVFGEIYSRYHQKIFFYSSKILKDRDKAFDLTQDLFIKVADKISNLNNPVTFVAWLFRIAHNDCMKLLRENKKFIYIPIEGQFDLKGEEFDMESIIAKDRQIDDLQFALNQLRENDKRILLEKYQENKSIEDLMQIHGLSKSAVKMRLSRSKQKVRKLYQTA